MFSFSGSLAGGSRIGLNQRKEERKNQTKNQRKEGRKKKQREKDKPEKERKRKKWEKKERGNAINTFGPPQSPNIYLIASKFHISVFENTI